MIFDSVAVAKKQGMSLNDSNFNVQMVGSHGMGKTSVAKLYARFLIEIGVLPSNAEIMVLSGSALKHDGLDKTPANGVVIVDDAHHLRDTTIGEKVLDFILRKSEKLSVDGGKLVWVLTGAPIMLLSLAGV